MGRGWYDVAALTGLHTDTRWLYLGIWMIQRMWPNLFSKPWISAIGSTRQGWLRIRIVSFEGIERHKRRCDSDQRASGQIDMTGAKKKSYVERRKGRWYEGLATFYETWSDKGVSSGHQRWRKPNNSEIEQNMQRKSWWATIETQNGKTPWGHTSAFGNGFTVEAYTNMDPVWEF